MCLNNLVVFTQDACLKGKNVWHQHLPTKKLTAYLIASFHFISLDEKMANTAIIDQNKSMFINLQV